MFMHGLSGWPVFNDVNARLYIQREYGLDGTLLVSFSRKDADKGASDFLEFVCIFFGFIRDLAWRKPVLRIL